MKIHANIEVAVRTYRLHIAERSFPGDFAEIGYASARPKFQSIGLGRGVMVGLLAGCLSFAKFHPLPLFWLFTLLVHAVSPRSKILRRAVRLHLFLCSSNHNTPTFDSRTTEESVAMTTTPTPNCISWRARPLSRGVIAASVGSGRPRDRRPLRTALRMARAVLMAYGV